MYSCTVSVKLCRCHYRLFLNHGGRRAHHSDWHENSFIMVIYKKKIFVCRALDRKFWLNFKKNSHRLLFKPIQNGVLFPHRVNAIITNIQLCLYQIRRNNLYSFCDNPWMVKSILFLLTGSYIYRSRSKSIIINNST